MPILKNSHLLSNGVLKFVCLFNINLDIIFLVHLLESTKELKCYSSKAPIHLMCLSALPAATNKSLFYNAASYLFPSAVLCQLRAHFLLWSPVYHVPKNNLSMTLSVKKHFISVRKTLLTQLSREIKLLTQLQGDLSKHYPVFMLSK